MLLTALVAVTVLYWCLGRWVVERTDVDEWHFRHCRCEDGLRCPVHDPPIE